MNEAARQSFWSKFHPKTQNFIENTDATVFFVPSYYPGKGHTFTIEVDCQVNPSGTSFGSWWGICGFHSPGPSDYCRLYVSYPVGDPNNNIQFCCNNICGIPFTDIPEIWNSTGSHGILRLEFDLRNPNSFKVFCNSQQIGQLTNSQINNNALISSARDGFFFGTYDYNSASSTIANFNGGSFCPKGSRFYAFREWVDGEMTHDCIPLEVAYNGQPGFYDNVTNQFLEKKKGNPIFGHA